MAPAAAQGFFDAMKSQPLALALAVIVILLLYFIHDIRQSEMKLAADHQKQVNEMIARFCAGRQDDRSGP